MLPFPPNRLISRVDISDSSDVATSPPPPTRAGHVRSLSGTLEEINASAALDASSRLPRIYDPPTGLCRVRNELTKCVAFLKTQTWLPTAVLFLGVVLLIAVPSISLLSARHTGKAAGAETNSTGINTTHAVRRMLRVEGHVEWHAIASGYEREKESRFTEGREETGGNGADAKRIRPARRLD